MSGSTHAKRYLSAVPLRPNWRMVAERAAASLEIPLKMQNLGVVSYLTALNAQRAYQQAVINLTQAQANRYADTAALFQALGGGWWNRHDSDPSSTVAFADNRSQPAKLR